MIFNEIVLEGVRRFKALRRIPLKPGFNLVYGPNEFGKTTLNECLFLLLEPRKKVGDEEEYPTWGPPGNSRAGLIIQQGQDQFRLTRDFVNGQATFAQFNPQAGKFDSIIHDPSEIDRALKQKFNLPPISIYRKLFCFNREDMPSGRSKVVVKKIQAAAPESEQYDGGAFGAPAQAAPAQPPAGYGLSVEEKKARIEQLRELRDQAQKTADTQFEIDGLENKLFEIENKIKNISSMEDQKEQIQNAVNKLSSFQELPPDIIKRIEDFEGAQREQNKQTAALDQKISQAQSKFQVYDSRPPFFKEQFFIIGAACVVGGIALHALNVLGSMSNLVVLPFIAGIGLMFYVLWKEISARGGEGEAKQKLDKLEAERREAEKKFQVENSVIKRLMEQAEVEDPKELRDKLKEYKTLSARHKELRERVDKDKKAVGFNDLEREQKQYQERIEELNKVLREMGGTGFTEDPADIQRQIDALQYSIDNPDSPAPPPPAAGGLPPGGDMPGPGSDFGGPTFSGGSGQNDFLGGDGGDDFLSDGGSGFDTDSGLGAPPMDADKTVVGGGQEESETQEQSNPVDELWQVAETYSGMDRSTIIMQIQDEFNAYVQAFTSKVYAEGDLSSEKTLSLRNASGSYTDLGKLSPSSQDAAWLALKLALIENLLKKAVLPVVMDDPLRFLDDYRMTMVSRALKKLAAQGQVILLSTHKAHGKIADHAVSLAPQNSKK